MLFLVPWVVFDDFLPQQIAVDVGINLGGADAFVSQHTLDGTQVGTAFEQMGGERVAESMGADAFFSPIWSANSFII